MRTGIMGGTFNPIHNAHLMIAEFAREQFGLDSVWFMTSGNPPHKRDMNLPNAKVRQEMVRAAIEDNPHFEVCTYEVERTEYSYTANTLTEFSEIYPNREFYFIIGADSLEMFHKWYKPQIIAKHCTILVFARKGTEKLEAVAEECRRQFDADIHIIDAPVFDISSSMIRKRIGDSKSVKYMIPDGADEYIKKHNLYR